MSLARRFRLAYEAIAVAKEEAGYLAGEHLKVCRSRRHAIRVYLMMFVLFWRWTFEEWVDEELAEMAA